MAALRREVKAQHKGGVNPGALGSTDGKRKRREKRKERTTYPKAVLVPKITS